MFDDIETSNPYKHVANKYGVSYNDVKAASFFMFYSLSNLDTFEKAVDAIEFVCELAGVIPCSRGIEFR